MIQNVGNLNLCQEINERSPNAWRKTLNKEHGTKNGADWNWGQNEDGSHDDDVAQKQPVQLIHEDKVVDGTKFGF